MVLLTASAPSLPDGDWRFWGPDRSADRTSAVLVVVVSGADMDKAGMDADLWPLSAGWLEEVRSRVPVVPGEPEAEVGRDPVQRGAL